jgi:hypothetical protein
MRVILSLRFAAATVAVALLAACEQLPRTATAPASAAPVAAPGAAAAAAAAARSGRLVIHQWPLLSIDGRELRAAPGARIIGPTLLTVTPNMVAEGARVQYELDGLGQVRLIRILDSAGAPARR